MEQIIATLAEIPTVKGELTVEPGLVPSGKLVITENGNYKVSQYAEVQVEMLQPSGGISISENGSYDVTNYETAQVAVPQPSGSVTITENGQHDVTDFVTADVQVPQPSGSVTITENGQHDVTDFVTADVQVPQPSGSIEITENGTVDVTEFVQAVVDVHEGATNVVCGEFVTGSAMELQDVEVPYSGNGYPVAVAIFVKEGTRGQGSAWETETERYAVGAWCAVKSDTLTPPAYDGSLSCYCSAFSAYKSSASNATALSVSAGEYVQIFRDSPVSTSQNAFISIVSPTLLRFYVANGTSNFKGFQHDLTYTYAVVYSE